MTEALVALAGPPGSGKSTAGRLAARYLGLEFVALGALFRAEADRRGVDLEAFSQIAERDLSIDRTIDAALLAAARPGRLLDGRLSGALLRREGIACRYVVVTATEGVRAQRIADRDHRPLDDALARMRAREASERRRYQALYGIDLDRERPDLTIDSTERPASEVAVAIERFVRAPGGPSRP